MEQKVIKKLITNLRAHSEEVNGNMAADIVEAIVNDFDHIEIARELTHEEMATMNRLTWAWTMSDQERIDELKELKKTQTDCKEPACEHTEKAYINKVSGNRITIIIQ